MDYVQSEIKTSSHILQLEQNRNEVEGGIVNMNPAFTAQSELIKAIQEKENRDNTTESHIQRKCCNNLVQKCSIPVQQAVIQRTKEDIPDAFWQECTELVLKQLERKKKLDKTNDSDLLFVLEHLNRFSLIDDEYGRHATLLSEIMQYNVSESPQMNSTLERRDCWEDLDDIDLDKFELEFEDIVGLPDYSTIPKHWDDDDVPMPATTKKKGTPTEVKMDKDPEVTVDYGLAFLGSDKDNSAKFGQQKRPANILEPAIKEFQRLAAEQERTQGEVPIHMASHMRDNKVSYGESALGWNISNENIRMVLDIIKKQTIVLFLHPNLQDCFSTSDELSILELYGYKMVDDFLQGEVEDSHQHAFDGPVLYKLPNKEIDPDLIDILKQVAVMYINLCTEWEQEYNRRHPPKRQLFGRGKK